MDIELDLIHYGACKYRHDLFKNISDEPFRNKPRGGLWASPVNSTYGWREWALENNYGDLSLSFKFKFRGKLLVIDSVKDMNDLPWIDCRNRSFISFQALCCPEFYCDAIWLTEKGEAETRYAFPRSLYGWDCESVLILNPNSIIEI